MDELDENEISSYFASDEAEDAEVAVSFASPHPPSEKSLPNMKINDHNNESETDNYEERTGNDHPHIKDSDAVEVGAGIKAIDSNVVHRICSGQVIVTLCTGVKELIENALDAGATSIELRLVEYGSESIELIDNGSGVDETDFEGLALKHHTSKISRFEDLGSVSTLGFRGEALSSLCALGDLTVATRSRASGTRMGTKLEYDKNGKLVRVNPCARECGTTVILKNIFTPLPVRRTELMKNLDREFRKMVNVLYAYCLINEGVRIVCTNKTKSSGSISSIVSIPPINGIKERIAAVFGSKLVKSVIEISQEDMISEEMLEEFGLNRKTFVNDLFSIDGFISKPNEGKSSSNRHFVFINKRPCDLPKISKIINETYHQFSRNQTPFVFLHIKTSGGNVDVNVTPDKRKIYLQNEKSLCALLKASLLSLFTMECSSFDTSSTWASIERLSFSHSQHSSSTNTSIDLHSGRDTSFAMQYSKNPNRKISNKSSIASKSSFKERFSKTSRPSFGVSMLGSLSQNSISNYYPRNSEPITSSQPCEISLNLELEKGKTICVVKDSKISKSSPKKEETLKISSHFSHNNDSDSEEDISIVYDDEFSEDNYNENHRPSVSVQVNWNEIKSKLNFRNLRQNQEATSYAQNFHAKIQPSDNKEAEKELKRQLNKEMFKKMEVIGQFNLGFLIVKLGSDLFIIDQHASDEKFNFEDLQKTTVLQTQKLIHPIDLQLPAISENIVIEKLEIFQKNGFDFEINPKADPTKRVKLTKIPYSKSCEFGPSDVEELIFMLEEDSSFCRPSKINQMLASRACRKSIMIGKHLNNNEIRRVVDHMGEMEHPWACPHGRPTIRHLINIKLLPNLSFFSHLNESNNSTSTI